jgi:hypothetical protein
MEKRAFKIGERIPGSLLTVTMFAESDRHGNQRVQVRCDCGTVKIMRATALTMKTSVDANGKIRKPHRSCGCESKNAYRRYLNDRAKGIRKKVRRDIWLDYQHGISFAELAARYPRLDVPVITAIVRLYNRNRHVSRGSTVIRGSKATPDAGSELDW